VLDCWLDKEIFQCLEKIGATHASPEAMQVKKVPTIGKIENLQSSILNHKR